MDSNPSFHFQSSKIAIFKNEVEYAYGEMHMQ